MPKAGSIDTIGNSLTARADRRFTCLSVKELGPNGVKVLDQMVALGVHG
jgi:hypothetical protein